MTQTIEQLVVELRADIGGLRSQLRVAEGSVASSSRKMERDLGAMAAGFGRVGSSVKTLGLGIGAALGVGGIGSIASKLADATRSAIEHAGALHDLATRAGLTAEKYQELRFAISQAGGDVGGLDSAVLAFSRNLSNLERGAGPLAKFLGKADPGFAETLRGAKDTGEAIDLLADRIQALGSEGDRLALIKAALGGTGKELANALAEGSAGLAEYAAQARNAGAVVSNEAIKSADDLADAVGRVADVVSAQFTSALLDAQPAAGGLLATLSDPETIKQIGALAGDVGELARVFLDLAAGAGRAIREIRNLEAFNADGQIRALSVAIADAKTGGASAADIGTLEDHLRLRMEARSASATEADAEGVRAQRGELAASLGFDEFGNPIRSTSKASLSRAFGGAPPRAPKASKGARSGASAAAARDPLASALATIREEVAGAERVADERRRFEEAVNRDLERATLSRVELAELETTRRIEELDRLGFATEQSVELRTKIEAEGAAQLEEIQSNSIDKLARIAEVGFETIGDFLASKLLDDSKLTFDELAKSFAKTLIRMEIQAAAASVGEILKNKLKKVESSAGSADKDSSSDNAGGASGGSSNPAGSILVAILGKIFGFADGGVVTGPVLGMIGEDPSTRPEIVMPLSKFEKLRGDGGAHVEVVNAVPGVQARARKVRRNGREKTVVELEAAFGALLQRGAFRDQLGGRHAPGMR